MNGYLELILNPVPNWIPPLPTVEQGRWRAVLNGANNYYATRPISLTVVDSTF